MKNLCKQLVVAVLTGALIGPVTIRPVVAQDARSAESHQLSVVVVRPLSFGRVTTQDRRAGAVSIDPRSGSKTVQGGALDMGGDHAAAEFVIRGEPNRTVAILLPSEADMISRSGTALGRLKAFTSHPLHSVTLGPRGEATVRVGATWYLSPNATRVEPRAQFSIAVEYLD